ncbi:Adhesin-like protein [Prochlorococcus sp. SS52]|nr:Adhesin-like protein [Prochlorococcus marinus str. LG]KGG20486.1 Adhesin-like protein [Prochlorococcus marinus str. SS2]KGG24152.1 Adhesin-like protein [Prochlorococcus marinus str. SS35]KGG31590.1 Adhesin-like protein [Prochlorococcus marinus str. SS51]KGG34657.1 Adhesin-like protein [Prochlorococcus sp. SS52]
MQDITASTGGVGATASLSPKPEYDVKSYMLNVYRDFPGEEDKKFYPYVAAGLGTTNVKMQNYTTTVAGTDVVVVDDGRDLFTWNLKGGMNYKMNDKNDLFAEANYTKLEKFTEDSINYDALSAVNLLAGWRYKF